MKYILTCLLLVLSLGLNSCVSISKRENDNVANSGNVNKHENDVNNAVQPPIINKTDSQKSDNDNKHAKVPSTIAQNNITTSNTEGTGGKGNATLYQKMLDNKEMLMRTFYVLLAVTSIVVIYFVLRAYRTRRRCSKSRKYGLITSSGADLEMEPLDQGVDDDDEMTMFERRK